MPTITYRGASCAKQANENACANTARTYRGVRFDKRTEKRSQQAERPAMGMYRGAKLGFAAAR